MPNDTVHPLLVHYTFPIVYFSFKYVLGFCAYIDDISARESTTKVRPNQSTRNMVMMPPVPPLLSARYEVLFNISGLFPIQSDSTRGLNQHWNVAPACNRHDREGCYGDVLEIPLEWISCEHRLPQSIPKLTWNLWSFPMRFMSFSSLKTSPCGRVRSSTSACFEVILGPQIELQIWQSSTQNETVPTKKYGPEMESTSRNARMERLKVQVEEPFTSKGKWGIMHRKLRRHLLDLGNCILPYQQDKAPCKTGDCASLVGTRGAVLGGRCSVDKGTICRSG
jgi:hypothetical protein